MIIFNEEYKNYKREVKNRFFSKNLKLLVFIVSIFLVYLLSVNLKIRSYSMSESRRGKTAIIPAVGAGMALLLTATSLWGQVWSGSLQDGGTIRVFGNVWEIERTWRGIW